MHCPVLTCFKLLPDSRLRLGKLTASARIAPSARLDSHSSYASIIAVTAAWYVSNSRLFQMCHSILKTSTRAHSCLRIRAELNAWDRFSARSAPPRLVPSLNSKLIRQYACATIVSQVNSPHSSSFRNYLRPDADRLIVCALLSQRSRGQTSTSTSEVVLRRRGLNEVRARGLYDSVLLTRAELRCGSVV